MTATLDIYKALHARYSGREWVRIQEAPQENCGGRRADFVAVGVWRGTGNQVIGHEVKVSRSDWQKELQDPAKSDAFIPYCDRWFVVAPPKIVKLEELRASWGLMELTKGGSLRIRRQAEKNADTKPLPRNMMAAWMRRIAEGASEAEIRRARAEGAAQRDAYHERERQRRDNSWHEHELESLRKTVREFEEASGIEIRSWNIGRIGEAVNVVTRISPSDLLRDLGYLQGQLSNVASKVNEVSEWIEKRQAKKTKSS